MNFLVKAPHWLLFAAYMLPALAMPFVFFLLPVPRDDFNSINSVLTEKAPFVLVGFSGLIHIGWMVVAYRELSKALKPDLRFSGIPFLIASIYLLFYLTCFPLIEMPIGSIPLAIIAFGYCAFAMARVLKSVESGRKAKFQEFIIEFVFALYFPIGIWLLQPRVNHIISKKH